MFKIGCVNAYVILQIILGNRNR